jgi:hypothetical protein
MPCAETNLVTRPRVWPLMLILPATYLVVVIIGAHRLDPLSNRLRGQPFARARVKRRQGPTPTRAVSPVFRAFVDLLHARNIGTRLCRPAVRTAPSGRTIPPRPGRPGTCYTVTSSQSDHPVSSRFRLDVSRRQRIGRVSSEWFARFDNGRLLNLPDHHEAVRGRAERAQARTIESRAFGWKRTGTIRDGLP